MNTSKVLAFRFDCANGKKYNVRIKDAYANATPELVKEVAQVLIDTKAFDFDGKQSAYTLNSATFTTTEKKALIAAAK